MPITLLSTQVPIPTRADVFTLLSGSPSTAKAFATGETTGVASKLTINAVMLDLAFRYGGGSNGILYGLGIVTGSGLNVTVGAGHAVAGSLVEVGQDRTVAVPASAPYCYLWIDSKGTVQQTLTTAPYGNNATYLGCVTTTANAVATVDLAGVCYVRNGHLYRETADAGKPQDQPPAGLMFYTKTLGGTYLWDGARYLSLPVA